MSDIPQAREDLKTIAHKLREAGMSEFADHIELVVEFYMNRETVVRRAARTRTPMTAVLREQIKRLCEENPDATFDDIGRMVDVAGGRVSEVLHGKWEHLQ